MANKRPIRNDFIWINDCGKLPADFQCVHTILCHSLCLDVDLFVAFSVFIQITCSVGEHFPWFKLKNLVIRFEWYAFDNYGTAFTMNCCSSNTLARKLSKKIDPFVHDNNKKKKKRIFCVEEYQREYNVNALLFESKLV